MPKPKKGAVAAAPSMEAATRAEDAETIARSVITLRAVPVMLAYDLADVFDTSVGAVNQYRRRNAAKFTEDYAFQLTPEEWTGLKSQNVISKPGRGGAGHGMHHGPIPSTAWR